jgi:hypothetical protein
MEGIKRQLSVTRSAHLSSGLLRRPRTVDDFDRDVKNGQATRARFIESDIVAIGKPQSVERIARIESLMAQDEQPGTVEEMCSVQEGKRMRISILRWVGEMQNPS